VFALPALLGNNTTFGTRKTEVLNSLIINITAKANDTTDISKRLQDVSGIVCFGRDIYYNTMFVCRYSAGCC